MSIVLPLCLARTHHAHTGTSWKKKKESLTCSFLEDNFVLMERFLHPSFSMMQNLWDQWWSCCSGRQRFFQVQCCDLSGYYDWYCSLPSSFQKFGHTVLSSCSLVHSLLPQEGCWQPLAGIQEEKQNTNPPSLSLPSPRSCCHGQWGVRLFLDKFCLPSFFPPLFKKQQLDSTAAH